MSDIVGRMLAIMESHEVKPKHVTAEFGVSISSFTDWSKGKGTPSVSFLAKFATHFDVSLDYLVFGEEHHAPVDESSTEDNEFVAKISTLSQENRLKLIGYLDCLILSQEKN